MLEVAKIVEDVEGSQEFRGWHEGKQESFLAHVFKLLDDANRDEWQVGYYNADDTITSFVYSGSTVKKVSSDSVFKHPGAEILRLEISKVAVDMANALAIAEKIQATEFSAEAPYKVVVILQNLKDEGQVYNITYITRAFKALNMKINAASGAVEKKQLTSLMDFAVR
ncbi:hypothetical protein HYU14_06585 [Candidatus Woesearchaeota archaeon]|nr:hypothetical protein [Candidatus Woesearchaeota archaeon]